MPSHLADNQLQTHLSPSAGALQSLETLRRGQLGGMAADSSPGVTSWGSVRFRDAGIGMQGRSPFSDLTGRGP